MKRFADCIAVSITLLLTVGVIGDLLRITFLVFANEVDPSLPHLFHLYWLNAKDAAMNTWSDGHGWPIVVFLGFCVTWTAIRRSDAFHSFPSPDSQR